MKMEKELIKQGYSLKEFDVKTNEEAKAIALNYRKNGYRARVMKQCSRIAGIFDYGIWVKSYK